MRKARKAAFELSMSFIIVVIFAVVMLTLGLTWIQGIFTDTEDLSDELFKPGQTKIKQLFSETEERFYIWPSTYKNTLAKNTKISFAAGIKNDADDGESHKYVINVYATQVPAGMATSRVNGWVNFDRTAKRIDINAADTRMVSVTIPKDAKKGDYYFLVAACWDGGTKTEPKSGSCNGDSDNLWGGSAKEYLLTIE